MRVFGFSKRRQKFKFEKHSSGILTFELTSASGNNKKVQKTEMRSLTRTRQVSTREKVPDRPMPALQWITAGPCSGFKEPDSRTLNKKLRNEAGDSGTPKSGQVV